MSAEVPIAVSESEDAERDPAAVPSALVDALFGRVPAEDLARYSPEKLAELARHAWDHLQSHRPGAPDICLLDLEIGPSGSPAQTEITVLQVINDDQPFLLDSTL